MEVWPSGYGAAFRQQWETAWVRIPQPSSFCRRRVSHFLIFLEISRELQSGLKYYMVEWCRLILQQDESF
jgi:hypothetical protein